MNAHLDGTEVTLEIPVADSDGNAVTAVSIMYRVVDGNDVVKVAEQALATYTPGAASATIVVPAEANVMAAIGDVDDSEEVIHTREARRVILKIQTASGTISSSHVYALEREQVLIAGVNSFQTYANAQVKALEISDRIGWDGATENQRVSALIEARRRIVRMAFRVEASDMSRVSYSRKTIRGGYSPTLDDMGQQEFLGLPDKFRNALCLAQIAEADYILNGDELEEMKVSGIISSTVGETSTTFKDGKALEFPICRKALMHVQRYVTFSASIGRG